MPILMSQALLRALRASVVKKMVGLCEPTRCKVQSVKPSIRILSFCLGALGMFASADAQLPTPAPKPSLVPQARPSNAQKPWPFGSPGAAKGAGPAATQNTPPPREVPLVEKPLDQISTAEVGEHGRKALVINPQKWKHLPLL